MKIETNRIILSCVFLSLAFVWNTIGNAQLRSIMLPQNNDTRVAQMPPDESPARATKQLVMQANQPSDDSSVLTTSHLQETENLPPADLVTMTQLDELQYGSPIAPGLAIFEVTNAGTEDALDVNVEIAVDDSARMLSIEPETTIIASKAARVRLGSIQGGQSKLVKVHSASGSGKPVQYTTSVVLESEPQFVSSDRRNVVPSSNPFPRNPVPQQPTFRKSAYRKSTPREPVLSEPVSNNSVTNDEPFTDAITNESNSIVERDIAGSMHENSQSTTENLAPEEPIVVKVETPDQFILGVPYRVYATVQNPTRSAISNVQISLKASSHLRSTPGFASFQTAARVASRHSARFEFEVFGVEPGNAELFFGATAKFEAEEGSELAETTNALIQLGTSEIIEVYKPAIRAKFNSPEFVHVGTEATYGIEVINESGNPMAATDVLLNVPEHLAITVLDRIAYKRSTGQIRWRVENLEPGKSELIQYKATSSQPGMQTQHAELTIQNRVFAESTCDTNVLGPSKLQVELQDLYSAVPIGEVVTLKINVKNEDDYDNELQVKVRLPAGVHAVNSETLQSNEHNEVLFKPLVVSRNSNAQLEIPLVGSVIGGQAIQVTVTSNTTFINRTTGRTIIFVNPQDAQYRRPVADNGPPVKTEPVVPGPVLTQLPDPVAYVARSVEATSNSERPASEFFSSRSQPNPSSEHEFHATIPGQYQPHGQTDLTSSTDSQARSLPTRIRPLIASRRTNPEIANQNSTSSADSNLSRRQPDSAEPAAMLPSSTESLLEQPASNSILDFNR